MKILAIIPARGGSKGVPGKNIKMLGKLPLLAYTVDAAKQSTLLSRIVLSSDDEQIISYAQRLNLEVPFTRPAALSQDNSPTLDVVIHALKFFLDQGESFDAVCLLQTTSPFRYHGLIDEAIEKFIQSGADSLISVLPVPHQFNPHWLFEPTSTGDLTIATGESKLITRRQELPPAYYRDGSIYITKSEVVLNQQSLYGNRITWIENNPDYYVNIDTPADWAEAENKLKLLYPEHI